MKADKAKKILAGLEYAKKFNPLHVMVVDADDCINQNIAKFVEEHPEGDGWYARQGYIYKEEARSLSLWHRSDLTLEVTCTLF